MWAFLDRWDERRATQDDGGKRVEPLAVDASLAFSAVSGDASLSTLAEWAQKCRSNSAEFYAPHRADDVDFRYEGDVLSFRSDIVTETEANNLVQARVYEARKSRGAIIVLPHWNASLWGYNAFSKNLMRIGLTVVELTLPYHAYRNRLLAQ